MGFADIIILVVIALILAGAVAYVVIQKKKGAKCIGCPNGGKHATAGKSCDCNHDK